MSGGSVGRKGCEARHNQLVCPLGQLSFDARQGHAAREMRATVRLRCGARARVVWVWCCTTQRSTRQQTAVRCDMKLLMGKRWWMGRMRWEGWMGWMRRVRAWLDGWMDGWFGAGDDGLRRRKRKQVGSRQPCSGRSRAGDGAGAGAGGAISSQERGSSISILVLQPSPGTSRTWMALNWMARLDRHRSSLGSARPVQGDGPAQAGPTSFNLSRDQTWR